jgi:glycosyltransferase involved in cell wall biosynthesis
MSTSKLRVLFVASHPVQYMAHVFRRLAQDPRLEMQVAYCSLQGADRGVDPEFGREVQWDVPLLEGYAWQLVPNRARRPGIGRFWGLRNSGLRKLVREGGFDAIVIFTGYLYASFWIVVRAAKSRCVPLVFGTDANSYRSIRPRWWKSAVKRLVLPRIFQLADVNLSTSAATSEFFYSMGIPRERVVLTPFVVDNDWWIARAAQVDRAAVRAKWGTADPQTVFLFCAKLRGWKRPLDAMRAFARLRDRDAALVFAGDGPLASALESEARTLGVADRVYFLGFVNQTELPAIYRAVDALVLTSEYDACPVVVCEAMVCGCPVIMSDSIRGRLDLVQDGVTGFVYPRGNVEALAQAMSEVSAHPARRNELSAAARRRMETWSPRENIEETVRAIETAVRHARKT